MWIRTQTRLPNSMRRMVSRAVIFSGSLEQRLNKNQRVSVLDFGKPICLQRLGRRVRNPGSQLRHGAWRARSSKTEKLAFTFSRTSTSWPRHSRSCRGEIERISPACRTACSLRSDHAGHVHRITDRHWTARSSHAGFLRYIRLISQIGAKIRNSTASRICATATAPIGFATNFVSTIYVGAIVGRLDVGQARSWRLLGRNALVRAWRSSGPVGVCCSFLFDPAVFEAR